jgi:hypothetical protein
MHNGPFTVLLFQLLQLDTNDELILSLIYDKYQFSKNV